MAQPITISSSPLRANQRTSTPPHLDSSYMSLSPPQWSEMLPKKSQLKSGSRAQPIPDGIPIGFKTATELVREFGLGIEEELPEVSELLSRDGGAKATDPAKKSGKKKRGEDLETAEVRCEVSAVLGRGGGPTSVTLDKTKKKIEKKSEDERVMRNDTEGEAQTSKKQGTNVSSAAVPKLRKTAEPRRSKKHTKQGHVEGNEATAESKRTERAPMSKKMGKNIVQEAMRQVLQGAQVTKANLPNKLELKAFELPSGVPGAENSSIVKIVTPIKALHRRTDWTPRIETCKEHVPCEALKDLAECFSYRETQPGELDRRSTTFRANDGEPLAKRQRVDVIGTKAGKSETVRPQNPKVSKANKPVTITSLAIAQVESRGQPSKVVNDVSLTNRDLSTYGFDPDARKITTTEIPITAAADTTTKRKRKKDDAKTKPKLIPPPKLPSPQSAILREARQNIMFGTSSQLARDDDPQFIRCLEDSLKAHDAGEIESTTNALVEFCEVKPGSESGHETWRQGKRNLWGVSVRVDGDNFPVLTAERREDQMMGFSLGDTEENIVVDDSSFLDIDTIDAVDAFDPTSAQQEIAATGKSALPASTAMENAIRPKGLRLASYSGSNPACSIQLFQGQTVLQNLSPNKCLARSASTVNQKQPSKCDEIDGKETKTTKGKSPAHKIPAGKETASKRSKTVDDDATTVSKRGVGRPRKGDINVEATKTTKKSRRKKVPAKKKVKKSDEWTTIDEIEDDCHPSPSPPRRRSPTLPVQLELSGTKVKPRDNGKTMEPEVQQKLFATITATIKAAARSTELTQPSWFEKILLYDPIVLEDLTVWLTSMGVRVNEEKLDAKVVQKWCEANSVCCLWREGLRGGVKKRY